MSIQLQPNTFVVFKSTSGVGKSLHLKTNTKRWMALIKFKNEKGKRKKDYLKAWNKYLKEIKKIERQ